MKPLLHNLSASVRGDASTVSTVQALRRIWPQWGLRMDGLEAALKRKKGAGAKGCNWAASAEGDGLKMQRVHSAQVHAQTLKTFHGSLTTSDSVDVSLGSGPEAGAYLVAEEGAPPMNDRDLGIFRQTITRPHGLVLLTGPTGSGKSTTLYAALEDLLHSRGGNVITVEDPIEYEMPEVSQVEIDSADKVSFAKALRSILRHDPDVIMIGEIRDLETAEIAVKASLTGHLVFSTLHTNTAAGVVTRLADMGLKPFLIAATLRLAVAQRLVRRLCNQCRVPRALSEAEAAMLGRPQIAGRSVYEAGQCVYCAGRGYLGRIALIECFDCDESVAKMIGEGASEEMLVSNARERNRALLMDDAIGKMLAGVTTYQEVLEAVVVW